MTELSAEEHPMPGQAPPPSRTRWVLLAGFGALLTLMLVVGLASIQELAKIHRQEDSLRKAIRARGESFSYIVSSFETYCQAVDRMKSGEPVDVDNIGEMHRLESVIDSAIEVYKSEGYAEESDLLGRLTHAIRSHRRLVRSAENGIPSPAWEAREAALQTQVLAISALITHRHSQERASADEAMFNALENSQGHVTRLTLLLMGLGLLFSLGSMAYILRLEKEARERYVEVADARRRLETLSAMLVEAQESERRALSRELHDEVGQTLGALLVDIGRLSSVLPSGTTAAAREYLNNIKSIAEGTLAKVRNISLLLRPSMLDDLGLVAALEWQAREVSRRSDLDVDVDAVGIPEKLPDAHQTTVFRFVQEALHNAARHSGAKRANVRLWREGKILEVAVEDNGKGFDPRRSRGLGLLGLDERIQHMGGKLLIESGEGKGAKLIAEIPVPPEDVHT